MFTLTDSKQTKNTTEEEVVRFASTRCDAFLRPAFVSHHATLCSKQLKFSVMWSSLTILFVSVMVASQKHRCSNNYLKTISVQVLWFNLGFVCAFVHERVPLHVKCDCIPHSRQAEDNFELAHRHVIDFASAPENIQTCSSYSLLMFCLISANSFKWSYA